MADEDGTAPVTTILVKKVGKPLRLTSMMKQSDVETGSVEVNGLSPSIGRLITRINDVVVQAHVLKQEHILIGRGKLCDIKLTNPRVSRRHALVVNSSKRVKLVDLGSKNGTFVNGRQIEQYPIQYALRYNDVIRVGGCMIEYLAADFHEAKFFSEPDPTETFEPHSAEPAGQF